MKTTRDKIERITFTLGRFLDEDLDVRSGQYSSRARYVLYDIDK